MSSVLVLGASSGIGRALAEYYRNEDCRVVAVSRSKAPEQCRYTWLVDTLQTEQDSEKVIAQALMMAPEIIFICHGVLHDETAMPEKTLRQLDGGVLLQRLYSNLVVPAQYMKILLSYLTKMPAVKVLVLSAKVGSITDNRLGGWYSYRVSKAGLNMLVKNAAIEVGRLNKTASIVSVHPGTTDTPLSQPFQGNLPDGQLQSTQSTAQRLAQVAANLTAAQSGALLNWDGTELPF